MQTKNFKIFVDGVFKKVITLELSASLTDVRSFLQQKGIMDDYASFVDQESKQLIDIIQEDDTILSGFATNSQVHLANINQETLTKISVQVHGGQPIDINVQSSDNLSQLRKIIQRTKKFQNFYFSLGEYSQLSLEEETDWSIQECLEMEGITIYLEDDHCSSKQQSHETETLSSKVGQKDDPLDNNILEAQAIIVNEEESKNEELQKQQHNEAEISSYYQQSSCYPQCFERSLILLIFYYSCKQDSKIYFDGVSWEDVDSGITQEYELFASLGVQIDLYSDEVQALLNNHSSFVLNEQWSEIIHLLRKIKMKVMTLNIQLLKSLISTVSIQAEKIVGQDIILLLGQTGSGKTTSIYFLAGEEMKLIKYGKVSHIGVIEKDLQNPDTKSLISAPFTVSMTKNITAVKINDEVGDSYLIVDTAGFGDINGPEVDIANGVAIIGGIQKTKSVRPVVVISQQLGNRLEGLKDLALLITGMLKHCKDHMETLNFIFTKFTKQQQDELKDLILDLKKRASNDLVSDSSYVGFLNEIIRKINQKKQIFLNPLQDNANDVLNQIVYSKKIDFPEDAFKFYITNDSSRCLEKQINLHTKRIKEALMREDYDLVIHKLDEIKYLMEVLDYENIRITYEDILHHIRNKINETYQIATNDLTHALDIRNHLSEEVLQKFEEAKLKDAKADRLKQLHFEQGSITSNDQYQEILLEGCARLVLQGKNVDVFCSTSTVYLSKLLLISQTYHSVQDQFRELLLIKHQQVDNLQKEFEINITNENIHQAFNVLESLQKGLHNLEAFIGKETNEQIKTKINEAFMKQVKDMVHPHAKILQNPGHIEEQQLEQINDKLRKLSQYEEKLKYQNLIKQELLENLIRDFRLLVINFFTRVKDKALELVESAEMYSQGKALKELVLQLTLIKMIVEDVQPYITEQYLDLKSKIFIAVTNISNEIENKLNLAINQQQLSAYADIKKLLMNFEVYSWLEDYEKDGYSKVKDSVIRKILEQDESLSILAYGIKISLNDPTSLSKLAIISYEKAEINKMKLIQQVNEQNFQEVNSHLERQVMISLDYIKQQLHHIIPKEEKVRGVIDLTQYERMLLFLKEFDQIQQLYTSSLFHTLKNKASEIFFSFQDKIKELQVLMESQIYGAFDFLKQFDGTNQDKYSFECTLLLNLSAVLQEVQDKTVIFRETFDPDNKILRHWKENLKQYCLEMESEIFSYHTTSISLEKFKHRLRVIGFLRNFDDELHQISFKNIHQQLVQRLNSMLPEQENKLAHMLDNLQFRELQSPLQHFHTHKKEDRQAAEQLQYLLPKINLKIDDLIQHTKNIAIQTQHSKNLCNPQLIEKFKDNMEKLSQAKDLEQFLDRTELLEESLKPIKNMMNKNIVVQIEKINDYIKMYKFENASQYADELYCIMSSLDCTNKGTLYSETWLEFSKIEETQKTTLHEIELLLQKQSLKDYALYLRKDILSELEKVSSDKNLYNEYQTKFEHIMIEKSYAEIASLAKKSMKERKNQLNSLKVSIRFLPQRLLEQIQREIEEAEDMQRRDEEDLESKIEDAIDRMDHEQLRDLIKIYRQNKEPQKEKKVLKAYRQVAESHKKNLVDLLRRGFNEELINVLVDTDSLLQNFKLLFKEEASKEIMEIKLLFSKHIKQDIDSIISSITRCSDTDNSDSFSEEDFEIRSDRGFGGTPRNRSMEYYFKFKSNYQQQFETYLYELETQLEIAYKSLITFFEKQNNELSTLRGQKNYQEIAKFLCRTEKQLKFLTKLSSETYSDCIKNETITKLSDKLSNLSNSIKKQKSDIKSTVKEMIRNLKTQISGILESEIQEKAAFLKHCININQQLEELEMNISLEDQIGVRIKDILMNFKNDLETKVDQQIQQVNGVTASDLEDSNICQRMSRALFLIECLASFNHHFKSNVDTKALYNKLQDIVNKIAQSIDVNSPIDQTTERLIRVKRIGINISQMKASVDYTINNVVQKFCDAQKQKGMSKLALSLKGSIEGKLLIQDCNKFEAFNRSIFIEKISRRKFEDLMKSKELLESDQFVKADIEKNYQKYNNKYNSLIENNLVYDDNERNHNLDQMISSLKYTIGSVGKNDLVNWKGSWKSNLPDYLAQLSAIWTIIESKYYFENSSESNQDNYLMKPHPAQIIAIFRMLGIGTKGEKLMNNIVQIGTGEGKSITLALASSLLALLGFEVSCVCYSQYLSDRDYKAFSGLFTQLNLQKLIFYGTFNQMCERIINDEGNIRELVRSIVNDPNTYIRHLDQSTKNPRILLIDEVDVFFSKEFYGELYSPMSLIQDNTITQLINWLWKNRANVSSIKQVKSSDEYQQVIGRFSFWQTLIDEAIKDMISDLSKFQTHAYFVQNGLIGYKEQDNIVFNINYGYQTLFAYFYEFEQGKIRQETLNEKIGLGFKCGSFSFAEVPKNKFNFIIGVSGTLKTLNKEEQETIKKEYGIQIRTYIPSMFGQNQLNFNTKENVKICDEIDFYNDIINETRNCINNGRAVLIFFEDRHKLLNFYNSPQLEMMKSQVKYLTEEATLEEKENIINLSSVSGSVTLFTNDYCRGTDFKQHDKNVLDKGGVLVQQTYISEQKSEEEQTKGRTARQGDKGSFSIFVLDTELEKFGITKQMIKNFKDNPYDLIDKQRSKFFLTQYEHNKKKAETALQHHKLAEQFKNALLKGDNDLTLNMLKAYNKGAEQINSRTIILMDATGSMYWLIEKAKATVRQMFERAHKILELKGYNKMCFALQFAAYRNYSSSEQNLLQVSPWTEKPEDLAKFLNGVQSRDGMGNEAVEVGLWHAANEDRNQNIGQVIIIGDYPPNTKNQVQSHKANYKWNQTRFSSVKHYEEELEYFIQTGIPVHAFHVDSPAEKAFAQIAKLTKGQNEFLDINSSRGEEMLTKLVTQEILRNVGGNDLVKEYVRMYS